IRPKRLADNLGRIGDQRIAIHRDAATGANKTGATVAADWLTRAGFAVNDDAIGVLIARAVLLHEDFNGAGIVGCGRPLDDVVVMLAPVEFADIKAVRASIAVIREPGGGSEIEVPIQIGWNGIGRTEAL